jgi:hypothetical protein
MKLEGRDPDPGRRATVQEQVSKDLITSGKFCVHSSIIAATDLLAM